jgi:hypothetical protein
VSLTERESERKERPLTKHSQRASQLVDVTSSKADCKERQAAPKATDQGDPGSQGRACVKGTTKPQLWNFPVFREEIRFLRRGVKHRAESSPLGSVRNVKARLQARLSHKNPTKQHCIWRIQEQSTDQTQDSQSELMRLSSLRDQTPGWSCVRDTARGRERIAGSKLHSGAS